MRSPDARIESRPLVADGVVWSRDPSGRVFVSHPQNRSQVAVVFEGTNADIAQQLLSGVALSTFAQNTAALGASVTYHRLRDVVGQLVRADVIRDEATVRWHESLSSDHEWPASIATTELIGLDLLEAHPRQKSTLLADAVGLSGLIMGLFGLWGAFSWLSAGLPMPSTGDGRIFFLFPVWILTGFFVRSTIHVLLWMGVGWSLGDALRLRLSLDGVGPFLKCSQNFRAHEESSRKMQLLFLSLASGIFVGISFVLGWFASFAWILVFTLIFLLLESTPFAQSLVSSALRIKYSQAYQGREDEFASFVSLIQRIWVFLLGAVLVLILVLLVRRTGAVVNWSDPAAKLSFFIAILLPSFAIVSLASDVIGDLLVPVLGDHAQALRARWLRRDRRSHIARVGSSSGTQWGELPLLRSLEASVRQLLLEKASEVQVPSGQAIVRLGDASRSLYILLAGEAVVRTRKRDGRVRTVARLRPGAVFGEAAFFLGLRRTADVIAVDDCRLLEVPHHAQMQSLSADKERSEELQIRIWLLQALVANRLFEGLPSEALDALVFAGRKVLYKPNEIIFRQGEIGDACYIIVQGEVGIVQDGRLINRLSAGEVFGELSLLKPKDGRTATAVVHQDLIAVRIPAAEFRRVLSLNWNLAIEMERLAALRLRNDHERRNQGRSAQVSSGGSN